MKNKLSILLLLIFNSVIFCTNDIAFKQVFDTESYNSMLTHDKDGFMWFATTDGVLKYNGYEVTNYKAGKNTFSSNIVPSLFIDSEGLIWIATISGLSVYDKSKNNFKQFLSVESDSNTIISNHFNWAPYLITESRDGLIWVATQNGVSSFNKSTGKFRRYLSGFNVWTIFSDNSGNIFAGTKNNGLQIFNFNNNNFERFKKINADWIFAINEDSNNNLWIGSKNNGLYKLNKSREDVTNFKHNPQNSNSLQLNEVFSIEIDSHDNLWLGRTYQNNVGLEKYDTKNCNFELFTSDDNSISSVSSNSILSIHQSSNNILWIPNNISTIDILNPNVPYFNNLDSLKTPFIIYEDSSKNIWVGTAKNGLFQIENDSTLHNFSLDNFSNHSIFSILEENKNKLWLGISNGSLLLYDTKKMTIEKIFKNPFGNIIPRSLIRDKKNSNCIWFSSEGYGIFQFNIETAEFKQFINKPKDKNSISGNTISKLVQDNMNNIWILTYGNGLSVINSMTYKIERYINDKNNPNSISGNQIMDFYIDSNGNHFVATDDGGLNHFNPKTNTFRKLGVDQFKTNSIRAIKEDNNGFLWLASDIGIYKYDFKNDLVLLNYTKKDGLLSDKFSILGTAYLKKSNGTMWFGSDEGINIFDPLQLKINQYKPPVVLTALTQNGEVLVPDKAPEVIEKVTLKWPESSFTFEYAALNYTLPEKSKYKYILEGYDTDWYDAGNRRFGRYSKLPGGEYTLRIKGTNNDGIWSDKEAVLKVTVIPPFWQTLPFKILSGLFFVLIVLIISHLRTKNVAERNKKLEELVKQRTKELEHKSEELSNKNVKLIDSIEYAKRIQQVTLPTKADFEKYFDELLLIYKPRDIVSGDFYWLNQSGDDIFVAVVDCTGHGVPGALLATIGNMLLNKYILEDKLKNLDIILEEIDKAIKDLLSTEKTRSFDGMDLSLCKINKKKNTLDFAGARNSLLYVTNKDKLKRINGTRRSLGGRKRKIKRKFEVTELNLEKITTLYMSSDGYPDQLNENNISMNFKTLFDLINEIKPFDFESQERILEQKLIQYRGRQSQTDDITLMGIKINHN